METFNATELIPILENGRRSKKVAAFLDNRRVPIPKELPKAISGRGGYTPLPIELLGEYLLWLTPKTREAMLNGVPKEEIVADIKNYW